MPPLLDIFLQSSMCLHPIILRLYNCQLIVMISSAGHNEVCFDFGAKLWIHIPSINTYQIKSFVLLHFNQLCGYVSISCSQQIVYNLIFFINSELCFYLLYLIWNTPVFCCIISVSTISFEVSILNIYCFFLTVTFALLHQKSVEIFKSAVRCKLPRFIIWFNKSYRIY